MLYWGLLPEASHIVYSWKSNEIQGCANMLLILLNGAFGVIFIRYLFYQRWFSFLFLTFAIQKVKKMITNKLLSFSEDKVAGEVEGFLYTTMAQFFLFDWTE